MAEITQRNGERLIPNNITTKGEYLAFLKHLFAYEQLNVYAQNCERVLEVGFGSGYGTQFSAKFFPRLTAMEVDNQAVEYAKATYAEENIEFIKYDGIKIPFDDCTFDLVYSFQVIEHVEADKAFILEAKRVLKPNGKLIMTTPNRLYRLKPGQRPFNRFHIREYSPTDLKELISECFENFDIYGVKGKGEVHQYELNRVKSGVGKIDPFRLRDYIPVEVKKSIRNLVNGFKGKKIESAENFKNNYSLEDYFLEKNDIDSTLDLMTICTK